MIWHFPTFCQSVSSMWSVASKPSIPRSREQRWSDQNHQRWRHHPRLLDNQSHYSHLKLPFVIRTLGNHQYFWIIHIHIVIWNNFVTAIYVVHQRPHFLLKSSILQNPYFHLKHPVADIKNGYLSSHPSPLIYSMSIREQFDNSTTPLQSSKWLMLFPFWIVCTL